MPSAGLVLLWLETVLPEVRKIFGNELPVSHFKVSWWEGESTKLDWIHLSQEKKPGSVKCVAAQGWLCCLLPFLHLNNFCWAYLLVLFFLPRTTTDVGLVTLGKTACWHFLDLPVSLRPMSPSFCCNTNILRSVLPLEACFALCWRSVCAERSQGWLPCFSCS